MARVSFPERVHSRTTAGLRQPLLGGCGTCGCLCRYALLSDEHATFATAGLRQPLTVHGVGRPKNNDIRGAQTHGFLRAAGVSPPWVDKSHPHTRPLFVGGPPTVCVRLAVAFAFLGATGGLRPPLLEWFYSARSLPAKLRLVRCTNARLQERRASARRGNETHLQWRGFLFRNEYVRAPRLAYASRSWLQHVRVSLQICAS
jgi:hypothetical protein